MHFHLDKFFLPLPPFLSLNAARLQLIDREGSRTNSAAPLLLPAGTFRDVGPWYQQPESWACFRSPGVPKTLIKATRQRKGIVFHHVPVLSNPREQWLGACPARSGNPLQILRGSSEAGIHWSSYQVAINHQCLVPQLNQKYCRCCKVESVIWLGDLKHNSMFLSVPITYTSTYTAACLIYRWSNSGVMGQSWDELGPLKLESCSGPSSLQLWLSCTIPKLCTPWRVSREDHRSQNPIEKLPLVLQLITET